MREINILIFNKDPNEIDLVQGIIKDKNIIFYKVNNENEILPSLNKIKPEVLVYRYLDEISEQTLKEIRKAYTDIQLKIILLIDKIEKKRLEFLISINISDIVLIPIEVNSLRLKFGKIFTELRKKDTPILIHKGQTDINFPKCLLVDNDRNFKNLFKELFNQTFNILIADNGEEAIRVFMTFKPEFVFLAENIKLINEKVLAQKIRSVNTEIKTKIYYFSSVLRSTSKPSMFFDGIIEKSYDPGIFTKHFNKILLIEKDAFKKIVHLVKEEVPEIVSKNLISMFSQKPGKNITILNKNETRIVKNDILFLTELIDAKPELSLTIALWASENDMRQLLDYICGEMIPFNKKAADYILSFLGDIIKSIQSFFMEKGIELNQNKSRLLNRNESKLNYDWDYEIKFKSEVSELFCMGIYCSKFV